MLLLLNLLVALLGGFLTLWILQELGAPKRIAILAAIIAAILIYLTDFAPKFLY